MIIRKFLHSCILLEKDGKKLLFDPGAFSFIEKNISPKDIGHVDVIILTHSHSDHYFPEALKELISLGPTMVLANHDISALLEKEGIPCVPVEPASSRELFGFTIEAIDAPHGRLPIECPHNLAYRIDKKYLHPGDSFTLAGTKSCEVLFLPIAGPWVTLTDALEFAELVHANHVIPVHDGIIKEFFLERMYSVMCEPYLKNLGIAFHPLRLGENLEID